MKQITLLYFAQLGAQAGRSEERLTSDAASVGSLFAELKHRYGWALPQEKVRFARNDSFCGVDEPFDDGDVLAIMPPMSGG
ncbi:MoaD/ThiS family protein [Cerasicoccus fimbriatus]|uniref:MoaD/ThiS family protein n=1 Tax=Cerasicoccus fimbriatus TaxID=3014554 RepID=UPI0022B422F5|nr:MoaD/ThiS family protein [Cerasicoccus sp. TK19100]